MSALSRFLRGQKALVTGASSGIGDGVARALAAAGGAVVVNYVSQPEAADKIVNDIKAAGGEAVAIRADVSDEGQVRAMFAGMFARFGTIDILVNNAGVQKDAPLLEMTLEQWNSVLGVNLTGQFLCSREAAREFIRRGVRPEISSAAGKIICISSVHEIIPWAGHINYAASKGGVMQLMKSLAQELAPHKIRVNSIAPGAIKTAINRTAWETPEAEARLLKLIPYDRVGVPEDIGKAAVWLASDDSDYVHGATLFVDGGMTLYPGSRREDDGQEKPMRCPPVLLSVQLKTDVWGCMGNADFTCNLSATITPLRHFWEHGIGSGHAPLALRADWQKQLRRCHEELGFRHVRFHDLFLEQMGTLICHKEKFLYSFFNADQIFDFLLSIGMRPFVELSFMPETLASGPEIVFHYRPNVTPPRDYKQWATLIRKLVSHWVKRYGLHEVRQWFFEVWNEPNLKQFWAGTREDYFNLYRYTVEAIKELDPSLRVGGPATASNEWIEEFLDFCEKNKLPADFVSTHHYPTDAFGEPGDDTEAQLFKSRRSVLRDQAQETRRRARGLPVYYTEWSSSSNPRDQLHDEPYAAAFATKTVMEANGLVESYSWWTFSDIFEENYFPSLPFHGGFGLLNLHGIPKPTYRAFELLHHLGTEVLPVAGSHETVDAWVVRKEHSLSVVLTNHALPRHPIKTEQVHIKLTDAPKARYAYVERIDEAHANPRRSWCEMGEPEYLSASEVELLQGASRMWKEPQSCEYEDRVLHLDITLPPHAVAAITVEFGLDKSE